VQTIFEEFTQMDGSTTHKVGGAGLGLPITKKLVEIHGGQIWVESKLDQGSIFTVMLPIKQPAELSNEPITVEISAG
jgi:signal transduction histidine kinase